MPQENSIYLYEKRQEGRRWGVHFVLETLRGVLLEPLPVWKVKWILFFFFFCTFKNILLKKIHWGQYQKIATLLICWAQRKKKKIKKQ